MSENSTDERPNVLVVFSDQQRWDTVGAYGNPMGITPNLDQAAEDGTLVEHAFTCQPVCGPARACIQTGTYATTNGVYTNGGTIPDVEHLLARQFEAANYTTGYVGKWHLGEANTDAVPENMRGGYNGYWRAADLLEFTSHPYEGLVYDENNEPVQFDGYRVDAMTDMFIDFIEAASQENRPFFGYLSYLEPHHQNDMDRYVGPEGSEFRHRNPWVPGDLQGNPGGDWYEELPDYYGICERIDECYGRILATLDVTGELENTVVLFTSDHGSHFYTRNVEYKRSTHEASIRVPMIWRGPGFENTTVDELVSLVDVAPTLLDAAGISVPDAMEGESIRPLTKGEHVDWRDEVFIQPMSGQEIGRALRTDRWKYSVYAPEANTNQPSSYRERYLDDLAADPHEQTNLIGRPEYTDIADTLRQRLRKRILEIEGADLEDGVELVEAAYYA